VKGYDYPLRACFLVVVGCLILLVCVAALLIAIVHSP
jgi:hypothetical protein